MDWIIGDIHGCLDQLTAILREIGRHDPDPQYYFTGDYCNRGPNSKGVVDQILDLGIRAHPIRGNHDDCFDAILRGELTEYNDPKHASSTPEIAYWFTRFGLGPTFSSYGATDEEFDNNRSTVTKLKVLTDKVPPTHHLFYRTLPLFIETPDFFIAHAYLPRDIPMSEVAGAIEGRIISDGMLWHRFDMVQIMNPKIWGKVGYFGHTPTHTYSEEFRHRIIRGMDMVLLDTGVAYKNGALTAICHQTNLILTCHNQSVKVAVIPYPTC